jgi:hypothetical protein
MMFIKDYGRIAKEAMSAVDPSLVEKYVEAIAFLATSPTAAAVPRTREEVGSAEYVRRQAINFADGRKPRLPMPPQTTPDVLVDLVLAEYFNLSETDRKDARRLHPLAMGAENLVGDLLERYLARILEGDGGWIWCSGNVVRAADFIRRSRSETGWTVLQVKNRDNSENSSSSAIRKGTEIQKWFRTFSRREATNWDAFPDAGARPKLSEDGFRKFAVEYLRQLRRTV